MKRDYYAHYYMRDNKKVEPIKEDAKEKVEPTKTAEGNIKK
jgi:hypothetical protein